MGKVHFSRYSDGEFQPSFEESVRGARVFIIGSTNPGSENLMEMLLMLDAAKRASARHITAVMPYFGWARQDRKDKPRVPIAAKLDCQNVGNRWGDPNYNDGFARRSNSRVSSKNRWITCLPLLCFYLI